MTANEFILLIILLTLAIMVIILLISRRKIPVDPKSLLLYAQALNHMLRKEYEQAVKELRAIIDKDTSHVDAYIKLGNLQRETGKLKAAAKIHQNLLYRQDISKTQRLDVMCNLVEDYIQMNEKGIALSVALNILDIDKKNLWALEKTWLLYRDLKKWAKATEYLEKLLHQRRETNKRLVAIYKVQEGLDLFESGDYHDARLIFRKAIKIDPTCEAPYYYYAESYVKNQREAEAVDWWVQFSEVAPDKAWMVFNPLQKILFNLGNFNKIEDFYLSILKHKPGDVRTITALANFYERKGDMDKAEELVEELMDANPNSTIAKIAYCKIMVALKREREISDILNDILYKFDVVEQVTCTHCGHTANEILWICPVCGTADSFMIQS